MSSSLSPSPKLDVVDLVAAIAKGHHGSAPSSCTRALDIFTEETTYPLQRLRPELQMLSGTTTEKKPCLPSSAPRVSSIDRNIVPPSR